MKKFLIRNDDVSFDTELSEIKRFCEICDRYGYKILHAITPIGEARKITSARMTNEQIRTTSSKLFAENKHVLNYLKGRHDFIGIHGLWHTHKPTLEEIENAKFILQGLGFNPTYFIPPFNEGKYPTEIANLTVCTLSRRERLEEFLEKGTPSSKIMYLHSWRFGKGWYTFDMLENCLKRLTNTDE